MDLKITKKESVGIYVMIVGSIVYLVLDTMFPAIAQIKGILVATILIGLVIMVWRR